MADELGVAQGSKPRPVTTAAVCAELATRAETGGGAAVACAAVAGVSRAAVARAADANRCAPRTRRSVLAEWPHVTVTPRPRSVSAAADRPSMLPSAAAPPARAAWAARETSIASVRPTSCAGQRCSAHGVPTYTAWRLK